MDEQCGNRRKLPGIPGHPDGRRPVPGNNFFSLSITPYINASIIVQLLTYALPPLERLQSEGEEGRKTLNKITAIVSFGLSIFMSFAYYLTLKNKVSAIKYTTGGYGIFAAIVIIGCFVAGSMLVMWLGNRISENGIGNGTSMILFAGIVARMPKDVGTAVELMFTNPQKYVFVVPLVGILFIAMITFIVLMNELNAGSPSSTQSVWLAESSTAARAHTFRSRFA